VKSSDQLLTTVDQLLSSSEQAQTQGKKGYAFVKENQGALEKLYALTDSVCLKR
jgi:3-deoxy-D-manno-octulosonic-acid transferase